VETGGKRLGLLPAPVIEVDPRRPADEGRPGEGGQAMANEQDGGHGARSYRGVALPAPRGSAV